MDRESCIVAAAVVALALCGPADAQVSGQPPDTMAERVLPCAPSHGAQGEGTKDPYFPRLAGKPAGYLNNQLVAFRSGRRHYPPMNYLLEFLTEDHLREMAAYFVSLNPPPAAPTVAADVLARGEHLVTQGDERRNIPACTTCHGLSGRRRC